MNPTVAQVFADVLDLPLERIDDTFSPETAPEWDSVQAMNLVMGLEDAYGVKFTTREVLAMRSVGAVRELLRSKGVSDV